MFAGPFSVGITTMSGEIYISDICFYIFKYINKYYINNPHTVISDDDDDLPPLLSSDMDFDDES